MSMAIQNNLSLQSANDERAWEASIIAACIKGDSNAFHILYERHFRKVYNLCMSILRNPSQAEDLTQEVFLQLFRKIASFRGDSTLSSWLYRVTINLINGYFRQGSVKREQLSDDEEFKLLLNSEAAAEKGLPVVNNIALMEAIEHLPPRMKRVFLLHDLEGFEHEEIGKIMGIDVGTSKSQLHKARLKLRKVLVSSTQ